MAIAIVKLNLFWEYIGDDYILIRIDVAGKSSFYLYSIEDI